jgi:hypothetical protein
MPSGAKNVLKDDFTENSDFRPFSKSSQMRTQSVGKHGTTLNLDGERTCKDNSFRQDISFLSNLDDPAQ